ncbi:hypothetical protein K435DRAFT_722318 [Dendrothele bispora CBS 962.96]|uniref:Uncharacterized protein n=1 Tax=Dendrothele bispora (strain CBS 962.96) TaxID=1314807 RepID=A0A4S8M5C2_DENBC|nr:hypothetical protein K435DRAFT_722318 [Dendrothele bispora CBS 962.96]
MLDQTMDALSMNDQKPDYPQGDILYQAGKPDAAMQVYKNRIKDIIGSRALPSLPGCNEVDSIRQFYIDLLKKDRQSLVSLMGCCNGIARIHYKDRQYEQSLMWLEEAQIMHDCGRHLAPKPLYDWHQYNVDDPEISYQFCRTRSLLSDNFLGMSNTGNAVFHRWVITNRRMPPTHYTPRFKAEAPEAKLSTMTSIRHPSPELSAGLTVVESNLQMKGSWKRIYVKKMGDGHLDRRMSFTSFIWNSRLYLAGGRQESPGPFYRDLWCLDLNELKEWRRLPDYPVPYSTENVFNNWVMVPYENKAYLFNGRLSVDYFDLVNETWSSIKTTYKPTRKDIAAGMAVNGKSLYPGHQRFVQGATMQIINGKLYVFGGRHEKTNVACNLFLELDLKTRKWRRLSGSPDIPRNVDSSCPGPRKNAATWTNKEKTKLFLMYGLADRQFLPKNDPNWGMDAYQHDDLWSWDIETERWKLERIHGNAPCPRSEMSFTYSEKLDRVIMFAGYNPTCPTDLPRPEGGWSGYNFSYYADTFILGDYPISKSPSTSLDTEATSTRSKWKQILTPGFPTYRCQAQLMTDNTTGKVYMYGGFTNNDFVLGSKELRPRAFGDLWQLRFDEPGGFFSEDGVIWEQEARTAKVGPWQRCFACGTTGRLKKCGGACNGKVFFCGDECRKDGWKEHKTTHGCHKK